MKLPDKFSELIKLAIADLIVIEKTPGYEIDMKSWHTPDGNKCYVCLAGCIMANTFKAEKLNYYNPCMIELENKNSSLKLEALDYLRSGDVGCAFDQLDMEQPIRNFDREITPYDENAEKFKVEMLALAKDLEKEGY